MTTRLTDPSLVVHDVNLDTRLDSVSFSAAPGTLTALIGPTTYVKQLNTVASEVYPTGFSQGTTITIGSVAGARTITSAP